MRMKKLLTLLLTAVIGCLPMWAGAGTDTFKKSSFSKKLENENFSLNGGTGAVYFTQQLSRSGSFDRFYFWGSYPLEAVRVVTPATENGKDCIIKEISITPYSTSYQQTLEVYVATKADFSDQEKVGELNNSTKSINVADKDCSYFKLVATNGNGADSQYYGIKTMSFTWEAPVSKVCEVPTVSANYWVPGGTVTLTAPTEGSTLTYSWGVDAEADVATATGTTVENAASPATITIPADAEVGKTFWVRATAKLDGYADSEELNFSQVLSTNVLAAPRFSQPSGNVDRGSWLYIERPRYATTIHYTTDGGATYETSTDYSVGMTINENMTITAYATGDAPFKESEKVTYNYTVVTPTVDTPTICPETGILPGTTLYLNADYDAYLSYSWGIKNGDVDVVKHEEETIQDSYVDITVPNDNIEIGYTLWVNATAKRDGYNDSEPLNFTYTFVGVKLDAPTFSLNGGQDLMAGTEVTIYMPSHATTLHYTLNGGEEQTSNENVTLTINENTEVKAWATGEGLYTKSDDATANFNLEVLGENVDVLVPTMWSDFTAGKYEFADHGIVKSSKTGIEYVFNGGYDVVDNVNTFYFGTSNSILYNTTGKKILRIKLESPKTSGNFVYVGLSTEAPLSQQGLSTIGFFSAEDYGVWKDVQAAKSNAQYFNIWSSGGQVSRILIEYEDTSVGVEGIASENGEAMYFDLNGAKVNSLENAVPGVYVRVANGKATKVLVK